MNRPNPGNKIKRKCRKMENKLTTKDTKVTKGGQITSE